MRCSSPSPGPSWETAKAEVGNLRPQVRPETPEWTGEHSIPAFSVQILHLFSVPRPAFVSALRPPGQSQLRLPVLSHRDACDIVHSPPHVTESAEVPLKVPHPTSCLSHIPRQSFPLQLLPPSTPMLCALQNQKSHSAKTYLGLRDNDLPRVILPVVREEMSQTCCLCCLQGLLHPRWQGTGVDASSETQQKGLGDFAGD